MVIGSSLYFTLLHSFLALTVVIETLLFIHSNIINENLHKRIDELTKRKPRKLSPKA